MSTGARIETGAYPPPPRGEPHWPPLAAVVVAIALQLLLPDRLIAGPVWLLPALEAALLAGLFVDSPQVITENTRRRRIGLALAALVTAANAVSLTLLAHDLLHPGKPLQGKELVIAGATIWLTNVVIFGLWFWEADRGGPGRRAAGRDGAPDLLFPQMSDGRWGPQWRPQFFDYLYVSLTNATAFSPTDTMPLTITAKAIMGAQSLISLVTIGLVVSRAVNIL